MMEKITTKTKMYEMLRNGEFGNHIEWLTFDKWKVLEWDYKEQFRHSIRFGTHLGAPWKYNTDTNNVFYLCHSNIALRGMKETDLSIVMMEKGITPILQGELCLSSQYGLYMHCSTFNGVMREALVNNPLHLEGMTVKQYLQYYCDPSSYDWLMELINIYPDHVIEFSVFDKDVGVIPHRNTVIWEVRYY